MHTVARIPGGRRRRRVFEYLSRYRVPACAYPYVSYRAARAGIDLSASKAPAHADPEHKILLDQPGYCRGLKTRRINGGVRLELCI
eukprot:COSAG02_NODE_909_length_16018_cov_15.571895_2_plen_86_part_00